MSVLTPDETILGLLVHRPQHGYQLLEVFRDPTQLGTIWTLSTSQLYAVLKRLEREGWIVGKTVESASAPPRTEYAVMETGRARLYDWLHEPSPSASIRRVRVEFLSRLYIARLLNLPTQALVLAQKTACQTELAVRAAERQQVAPGVALLALDLIIAQYETVLKWIDRCEMLPHEGTLHWEEPS